MNDAGRVGFIVRGNYDSSTAYDFLDIVFYQNSSYVAKKITVGNTPVANDEYWQIFASGAQMAGENIPGTVKPDGTTTVVSSDGTISAIVLEKDGEIAAND